MASTWDILIGIGCDLGIRSFKGPTGDIDMLPSLGTTGLWIYDLLPLRGVEYVANI